MVRTYIIGGTPRAGKSTLSKILFDKHHINTLSTDLIREGFIYGVPDFGILNDEARQSDEVKSEILWPYFKGLLKAREFFNDDLVIEGTNFEPKYLSEFRSKTNIRICFLGFTEVEIDEKFRQIRAHEQFDDNDWTSEMSDKELKELVVYLKQKSIYYKNECLKYEMRFIDTSENFDEAISTAANFLLV